MTKPNARYYFRDKRLAPRQKFHQKYLRPLALWVESRDPMKTLGFGFLFFGGWNLLRLFVIHFYWIALSLPWVILAIALVLAGASLALRRGRHGSSD